MRFSMSWLIVCLSLPPLAESQSSSERLPDSLAFAALEWREIGPYRGGRSVAVAGSSARPHEY